MSLVSLPLRILRKLWWILRGYENPMLRKCRRILHIGANHGQERDLYARHHLEVLWIEALPKVHSKLVETLRDYPDQTSALALLTDRDGDSIEFNVTSNEGESSSVFKFKRHAEAWPDIQHVQTLNLISLRLDTLLTNLGYSPDHFDGAVLDVQGAELLVLQGGGVYLDHIHWLQCEAVDFEAYEGACQLEELVHFLSQRGFRLIKKLAFGSVSNVGTTYELFFKRKK
ncbi:FkbM family methyltransferase [Prosthecobacter sp.]|jgi:FkbM family methyltransferase|uniref:FkbM family methyltransferase n=1 Tax=Prosthecobacter sp. TaxID=1965333 RepID=UPI0037CC68B6